MCARITQNTAPLALKNLVLPKRLQMAFEALRAEKHISPENLQTLKDLLTKHEKIAEERDANLIVRAEEIFETLRVSCNGFAVLTIPQNLLGIEVLKAFNTYFRTMYPASKRSAVWEGDFERYRKRPNFKRHFKRERRIKICLCLPETANLSREDQETILAERDLLFAPPEDIALISAAHACKYGGEDLLWNQWVRTSIPGVAVMTDPERGLVLRRCKDGYRRSNLAAVGVPMLEC